ncbi:MAG: response regulator transcription factor [Gammaproteobacteria bacterium]|nr:response regulator transcription factor [Gammaproteobacteria bacterium]
MSNDSATVFVVDDDLSVRRGLHRLLRSAGFDVELYRSGGEFLARAPFGGTGCVILDVQMPGTTGPELHNQIAERGISLPVVFLTAHGDVSTGVAAIKKGAVDFLEKPVDEDVLLEVVHQAIARHAAMQTHEKDRRRIEDRLATLSARERDVMLEVIKGRLNKQIGAALGITEKTVKVHRARVMEKMGVGSVAELVHLCDIGGIAPGSPAAEGGVFVRQMS